MQRLCAKLRSFSLQSSKSQNWLSLSAPRRLLHSSSSSSELRHYHPLRQFAASPKWSRLINPPSSPTHFGPFPAFPSAPVLFSLSQVRHVSSRDRRKKRKPMTPVTSKVKKTKIKFYSSYKSRFRTMNDGTIRRWREGKNHNAHLKSKKAKRRLRQHSTVPAAYAKVMKKLNFCG